MSERISRLAMVLFVLLSAAVALNLVLLQPLPGGSGTGVTARGPAWGAVNETAALAVPEIDQRPAAAEQSGDVGQRIVVTPPATDFRATTRAVQTALEARGYETGGHDGVLGPITQAAILAYEIDHGLPLTAEPSEPLVQQILSGAGRPAAAGSAAALTPGPRADTLIRTVQTQLARLGYPAGKADGRLGEGTINAIRQFEKQQGMPDTGRISGELVVRLTRLAGESRAADKR